MHSPLHLLTPQLPIPVLLQGLKSGTFFVSLLFMTLFKENKYLPTFNLVFLYGVVLISVDLGVGDSSLDLVTIELQKSLFVSCSPSTSYALPAPQSQNAH